MGFLKSRRTWLATAVVLILAVIALWPSSTLVDTARVDRGTVRATVDAEGRTRVIDRYVISAPVAATARRLLLEPGDQVSAGQELVALDPLAAAPLDRRSRGSAEAAVAAEVRKIRPTTTLMMPRASVWLTPRTTAVSPVNEEKPTRAMATPPVITRMSPRIPATI